MRKILLITILLLVSGIGYSQSDSLRYWKDNKIDAGMKLGMCLFSNGTCSVGVILNGWKDVNAVSEFIFYNAIVLPFDIIGIIQLCKANKNIKILENKGELSDD